MKAVVTGGGAVGRHLAQDLTERGHDVTLVEQRRDLAEKLEDWAPDTRVVYGDACEPRVLESADRPPLTSSWRPPGTTRTTSTSLLAKQEFGVPRVLARVNHPKNEMAVRRTVGRGRIRVAAAHPHGDGRRGRTVGDPVRLLRLEGGDIGLVEMRLPERSPNAGSRAVRAPPPRRYDPGRDLREGHVTSPSRRPRSRPATERRARARRVRGSEPGDAVVGGGTDHGRCHIDLPTGGAGTAGQVGAEPLAGEFEPGIDHPDVAPAARPALPRPRHACRAPTARRSRAVP